MIFSHLKLLRYAVSTLTAPGLVTGVNVTFITSSAMTVTWNLLSCLEENGEIAAYNVTIVNLNGINQLTLTKRSEQLQQLPFTLTYNGLAPSTEYAVYVEAVNTQGTESPKHAAVRISTKDTECKAIVQN